MREDDQHDLELHRRLSGRDTEAFDELYRRYGRSAYGVALRVTSQEVIAQEVVQDAFLALASARGLRRGAGGVPLLPLAGAPPGRGRRPP